MTYIEAIYQALLQFWEASPSGTREQFVSAVVSNEVATEDQANAWLDRFLLVAEGMAFVDSADFDAVMQRVGVVGLEKASTAASLIYGRLASMVDFKVDDLQTKHDQLAGLLATIETDLPLIAQGRNWIEANAPGGEAVQTAVLKAIDSGVAMMTGGQSILTRKVAALEEQIAALLGYPD